MSISKFAGALSAVIVLAGVSIPASSALADNQDRRVRIINDTNHTMVRFYASNSSRTSWEEDILGQSVLPSGRSVVINIDDGTGACMFDFKAVFDDGDELIRNRVNVCQISEYRYTE